MRKLFEYIAPLKFYMLGGLFLKFFAAMMNLLVPSVLAKIIDDVVPAGNVSMIFVWGGVMVLCSAADLVSNVIANRMATKSAGKITRKLRRDVYEKISYLSAKQTDTFTIPKLISVLTSDTYNVNQMLARMQRIGIRGPVLLIGGLFVTFSLDRALTLVLAALLPPIAVIVYFITKYSMPIYAAIMRSADSLVRVVRENFAGIRVIKALSKTDYEKEHFRTINTELFEKEKKSVNLMSITSPATTLILNVGLCLVILVGAYRVNGGLSQPGKIIAFMTYFTIILNAMIGITNIFIMYSKGAASMERIAEVLAAEGDLKVLDLPKTDTAFHVVFDRVCFSYNKVKNNVEDISFALKRGETLGIIGATGSGKSTLINLLIRFYDCDSGGIFIDGRDVRSIPKKELYSKFGIVFQNDFIMSDTIAENVRFGRRIEDEQVVQGLENAQAMDFVSHLAERQQHELTAGGSNISGGQKQRVLIARALATRPEILILDDSSSALDYKTDSQLRKTLSRLLPDTTKIIVAQRISSVKNSDHILVLEGGRMLGYGTHEELLATCGEYKSIFDLQMGGLSNEE